MSLIDQEEEKEEVAFVHLRSWSSYSMLESAIKIEDLISLAKSCNMKALALSDRNNLFASLEFSIAATKALIKPIHGIILNIDYAKELSSNLKNEFAEILILAKNEIGYKNLLKLASYIYIKNDRSIADHITFEDLLTHNEGLIILSAYTDGIIGKLLLARKPAEAELMTQKMKHYFQDRFYFEIMRHGYEEENLIESSYLELASKFSIPLVATNHVLFAARIDYLPYKILANLSDVKNKITHQDKNLSINCYFKTPIEMSELFHDLPEAIDNSFFISQRCSIKAECYPPSLPIFTDINNNNFVSEEACLKEESFNGLSARLKTKFIQENITELAAQEKVRSEYIERLEYELEIICKMQFSGYFLIVSEFIKWSKDNDIAVGPGRGSGAGSLVAWSLQITDLDPIRFGLLFERFLNPERISLPDFDIDFCQERREEVIMHVQQKYGQARVGQIITFGKMQAKAVIKDVARVMGLPYRIAEKMSSLVPFNAVNPVTLNAAIEDVPELKNALDGHGLYNQEIEDDEYKTEQNNLIKQILETALVLEGLHRHASTHAAGIVIANQDLIETVPLYKDANSALNVVQYSMKYCELAGLVKFDFLGLQTLTVITKCLNLLKTQHIHIDITNIPNHDIKSFEMLSKGLGTGVFQFESAGMKSCLKKLKPDCLEDLIALGALYRPGPMDNIPTFIACKHGKQEADYLHPLLEPILKETYGVIVYQEQVMEIAKILAGYKLGSADLLRRAMGKKVKAEMDAQREIFLHGAKGNNIPEKQANSIFDTVAKFAGYGFNKAHASAYGVISYQTAYLKANYPVEFLVASMNSSIDDSDKIAVFIQEANILGVDIINPSINKSRGLFSIEIEKTTGKKSIIYALGAIKNIVTALGEDIFKLSQKKQFSTILDFIERIDSKNINKRMLENLIKSGSFDEIHSNRVLLFNNLMQILSYSVSYHKEKQSSQGLLISVSKDGKIPILSAIKQEEILDTMLAGQMEFEVLGLFLTHHPLKRYQKLLSHHNIKDSYFIQEDLSIGTYNLSLSGVVIKKDSRMSNRGRFVTITLSDLKGFLELTIYHEAVLKEYDHLIEVGSLVSIEAEVTKDEGGIKILPRKFENFLSILHSNKTDIILSPNSSRDVQKLTQLIQNIPQESNEPSFLCDNVKINIPISYYGLKFVAKIQLPAQVAMTSTIIESFMATAPK